MNLWLFVGLTFSTSLMGQQVTNPPAAQPIEAPEAQVSAAASTGAVHTAEVQKKPKAKAKAAAAELVSTPLQAGPAIVIASNVNVRGQAKLRSEVVTRVNKGQQVTVLEEVVLTNSAADEPSAWAKILLPENATVWVHSLFVSNNTVVPNRLNLRSGPGENYSILGRIPRGTAIQPMSTKEQWIQIPAPADAYGFVAAQYLKQEPDLLAANKSSGETAAPATPAPEAPVEPPATVENVQVPPTVAPPPVDVPVPAPAPATPPAEAVAPATVADTATNAAPEEPAEDTPVKRIVQREGVVRGTSSIQAPTAFALVSPVTGKMIDYLYSSSEGLDLRRYKGMHIIVTGEEALEERWGNTPVLTIQKLEVLE
jgi:uncharacterized protein YgiM (DUF1202 family)